MDLGVTFENIWPMVQVIIEPLAGMIQIGLAIAFGGILLGVFIKFMRA